MVHWAPLASGVERQVQVQVVAPALALWVRRLVQVRALLKVQFSFQLASWVAWPVWLQVQALKQGLLPEQEQERVRALAQVWMQAQ